jgi:integrase
LATFWRTAHATPYPLRPYVSQAPCHRASGQAVVTLNGIDHYLGPHATKASKLEYDRLIRDWLDRDRQPAISTEEGLLIIELVARYWVFAKKEYVRHGRPAPEQFKIKTATQHLLRNYENHRAEEFGPKQLKSVRQSMIAAGWARSYIKRQVGMIVRMFKWAVTEGLLPASVHAALNLVQGIQRGETPARETSKVRGIDDATVKATLPYLSPTVQAMVELQLATGMRPGELCILRPVDLDRSDDVWEYVPQEHKTQYHDHDRVICIGPKGQDILRPFLLRPADSFCFSPAESMTWHRSERHAARKTPESCGNTIGTNRKRRPTRTPRDKYDVARYRRAIHRACDQAFSAPENIADDTAAVEKWKSDHRWSPHQLRHSMATRVRKEFDIEAAKAVLGHAATNVTGIYAEVDRQRAIEVARLIG